jgi:tRNA-2-methylthio-N6-dimethylallyladenosine synthase
MKQKTYCIITIGCQMNKSDSERIAGYLNKLGFKETAEMRRADLVVLTTCGVRQSAEDRIYGLAPKIKKENKKAKIIITGCLSERDDVKRRLKKYVDIWLPITELDSLAEKLGLKKKENSSLSGYLAISPKYDSSSSAFVPIGNGCDNFCSYCVVPYARGREVYRPAEEIVSEVKNLIKRGYKEIILIAQNVNSYVSKKQQNLPTGQAGKKATKQISFSELLRMVNDIEGDFWIRFSTSHPKDMSDDLIAAVAGCEKVCEHIHLPIQSGDNEILRRMNRKYTREHYVSLIKKISKHIPEASITTDIIVGFPSETKKQFNETAKLFREVKFDMAYISKYSPRPNTAAFKFKDNIRKEEKKRREEELLKILRKTASENSKKYIGKIVEVLVEGKNKKGEWFGKTRMSKGVKVKSQKFKVHKVKSLSGQFARVKIFEVKGFRMEGEIVN